MTTAEKRARRMVVKVGTAVLSAPGGGLNHERIAALAAELCDLKGAGWTPVLVTSGAIGAGMDRFGWTERPTLLKDKQAAAAVGQVALMNAYDVAFKKHGVTVAQVLLTRADLEDRERYLNARATLNALLELGVIPVLNENDTVATEEIKFGDNDTLAAHVAVKLDAGRLIILSDVDGLLENVGADPRVLPEVFQITPDVEALVQRGTGSKKSVGGMQSKILAARMAMASGVETWIASGRRPGLIAELMAGRGLGTRFKPLRERLDARRRWTAFGRPAKGALHLDAGAVSALVKKKSSLLPSGVTRVEGRFDKADTVRLLGPDGREIGRGAVRFSSSDVELIRGRRTDDAMKTLGRSGSAEIVHRNDLVLFALDA